MKGGVMGKGKTRINHPKGELGKKLRGANLGGRNRS